MLGLWIPQTTTVTDLPVFPREFRAVWVATVDNIDWPTRRDLTTAQQQAELAKIFDVAQRTGLNAVILQMRPSADALYPSKLEPWSEYLTGLQGRGPSPAWDPLEWSVKEAHRRGMELHVWFNPFRARHPAQKGPIAKSHLRNTDPGIVKEYGKHLWMDPGEPKVRKRFLDVVRDVVTRYDVDGVHIDDYFYPYKEKDAAGNVIDFPDEPSYRKYGNGMRRDDWRRKNVDTMVHDLYDTIKKTRKTCKFGISPFGLARPGKPASVKTGFNQYADLYADAEKWLVQGWCDYYTPQLYWQMNHASLPYATLLEYWKSVNPKQRHLWPGLFTGRTMPSEGNWPAKEIQDQIDTTRRMGSDGHVHFSMRAFLRDSNGIASALADNQYREPALLPDTPWLSTERPGKVKLDVDGSTLRAVPQNDAFVYARWSRLGNRWKMDVVPAQGRVLLSVPGATEVYVAAVNRNGTMGPVTGYRAVAQPAKAQ